VEDDYSDIDAARRDLAEAEALLRSAVKKLESAPRADKITISESLRSAFAHLHEAKTALTDIEALLGKTLPTTERE